MSDVNACSDEDNDLTSEIKRVKKGNRRYSIYASAVCFVLIFLFGMFGAFVANAILEKNNQNKIGVIDIVEIMQLSEMVLGNQLINPELSDAEKINSLNLVKETGNKIQLAIDDIKNECKCILITKAAILGGDVVDYTENAKKILGINDVNKSVLEEKFRNYLAGSDNDKPSLGVNPLESIFMNDGN